MQKFLVITIGVVLLFSGCAQINTNIRIYSDPGKDFKAYKTFDIRKSDKNNPMVEEELLQVAKNHLQDKGFISDEKRPDFLIYLSCFGGTTAKEYYGNVQILVIDSKEMVKNRKANIVWKGKADNQGKYSDIKEVAPSLIKALLDEFPYRSGNANVTASQISEF